MIKIKIIVIFVPCATKNKPGTQLNVHELMNDFQSTKFPADMLTILTHRLLKESYWIHFTEWYTIRITGNIKANTGKKQKKHQKTKWLNKKNKITKNSGWRKAEIALDICRPEALHCVMLLHRLEFVVHMERQPASGSMCVQRPNTSSTKPGGNEGGEREKKR